MTSQEESPVGLDQSDEDDDNSSDYFADAETSSCGSSDDDTGWPEISKNKGSFVCLKRASTTSPYLCSSLPQIHDCMPNLSF